jgi:tripartite-type tricarboxylate transporter receptor subunit TctC
MRISQRSWLAALALVCAVIANASPVWAEYPARPIHIVVTYLAGGSADTLARIVGQKLEAAWGHPVVVENRAGANGNIGAEVVAKSPPDGYTIMFTPPSPLAINMFLYKSMPFDPQTAFAPISVLGLMPNILVVGANSPFRTVHELVDYAQAHPGKITYGSQGVGSTPHLTGAMLVIATGIHVVHVPYRGFPPLLVDLLGSRLDFAFADPTNALPQITQGQLRALGVASAKRFFALPDTPTLIEAGVPDFLSATWMSFAAPAGMPPDIVEQWHNALVKIVRMPDVKSKLADLGLETWASTPEEMHQLMLDEMKRWNDVIRMAGVEKQ